MKKWGRKKKGEGGEKKVYDNKMKNKINEVNGLSR